MFFALDLLSPHGQLFVIMYTKLGQDFLYCPDPKLTEHLWDSFPIQFQWPHEGSFDRITDT